MDRRRFMGTLMGAVGAAVGASAWAREPGPLRSATQQVRLGKSTGIVSSFVGIGTGVHGWMRSSNATRMGREDFNRLIRHSYESGITFFDAADLYGTHPLLREALKGIPREKIVIQSKLWWRPEGLPEHVTDARAAVDRFCQELGTDYIDSLLVHCTTDRTWNTDLRPILDGLEEAKAKGRLRSHGTSCHSLPALQTSAADPFVQVQLARVNHNGASMDGKPTEISAVLQGMRASGKGVIGMKIFGEGAFRKMEDREASLRFVLSQQCVDMMVIGFETPAQIDETLQQMNRILAA